MSHLQTANDSYRVQINLLKNQIESMNIALEMKDDMFKRLKEQMETYKHQVAKSEVHLVEEMVQTDPEVVVIDQEMDELALQSLIKKEKEELTLHLRQKSHEKAIQLRVHVEETMELYKQIDDLKV